jgi:hypothetical protein
MPAAEWYHRKSEECVALAKGVRLNEERARLYALAEYYPGRYEPENGGSRNTRQTRPGLKSDF